ncbi:MAG: DUF1573 domain-containing protein, partial [Planctomycetota bacterium]|nr:DUF1573 domain-containing protein [Planctomycetota bacterium]
MSITSIGHATDWAKEMFKETTFDFGVIARGAKAERRFVFENIYLEDAHISSVRSSCGCTTLQSPTEIIKTYEQAAVVAKIDTRSFLGRKNATITVVFDKPFYATVDLHVHCYIRSDVVFQPGVVQFGSVRRGQSERRKTTISYAGSNNWQITSVSCSNPSLKTELVEATRFQGRTTYDLWVTLSADAKAGYINDQIILHTNDSDPSKCKIPLSVEGVVIDALTVRPAPLTFGILSPGQSATKNLVVRGHAPFKVTRISCPNSAVVFDTPTEAKRFHVLPITLLCPSKPGKIQEKIKIETDIPNTAPLWAPCLEYRFRS